MIKPKLPIPEPLRGTDPDSFTQHTVTVRLPKIVQQVLIENDFPEPVSQQLKTLLEEIPSAPIRYLDDAEAPDAPEWAKYIEPYLGLNWLQIPWFLAETYLYRRILEATGYFKPGEGYHADPFAYQKQRGLDTTQDVTAHLGRQLNAWVKQPDKRFDFFTSILMIALWGNQADLSLWPTGNHEQPQYRDLHTAHSYILINDTGDIIDYLADQMGKSPRIDFIADNAGYELVCDLALADFCLSSSLASTIVLHLKSHPTFVSDAMVKDVEQTVDFLAKNSEPETKKFGQRLQSHVDGNRLQLQHELFWTSPLSFWEMPENIRQTLAQSNLLISKGDANYRRLLGDCHWSYTTPLADIVSYLPTPLVALRTLKSEVGAGFGPEQIKMIAEQDPHWLTNGKRGVIQFVYTQ
jgi:uncharacterized protein with ATP-grasp and redox domains